MKIQFNKVTSLPSELSPNSFYYLENNNYAESYITDASGTAKAIGNSAMIKDIVSSEIRDQALNGIQTIEFAKDIEARDVMTAGASSNLLILVVDATGDPTVSEGSALYAFDHALNETYKVAEWESMDISLKWEDIDGRPTSTVAQIDLAVTQTHTHANKTTLDKLSEENGELLFAGESIATQWTTRNW